MDPRFGAWLAVSALLIVTPGPDTALVIRTALRSGPGAASSAALGIALGSLTWAALSVVGIAVLLEKSALAFTVLKLVGAAYLAYLGMRSLLGSFRKGATDGQPHARPRIRNRTAFGQGLLNNLLNPKAGAFFVAVLPQFVTVHDPPARLGLMMVAYDLMVVAWLTAYGIVVSRAGRSPAGTRFQQLLEQATGVVLIGLGVRLVLEKA